MKQTTSTFRIGGNEIGPGNPVFIIAEAGINHNGDLEQAKQLIRGARHTGADAVKFQTFRTDLLLSGHEKSREWKDFYALFNGLEFHPGQWREIAREAEKEGIIFLSTPFDEESLALLVDLGMPAIKVASGDITYLSFLRHCAQFNLPMILSTGMSSLEEIKEAVREISAGGCRETALLHCTSLYPTPLSRVNLRAMDTLGIHFQLPVGLSDHTEGRLTAVAAAARGAHIIEKHFTLSRDLPGPDHRLSLDPDEFALMVLEIRQVEKILGSGEKVPAAEEIEVRQKGRRSVVSSNRIPPGTVITPEMLTAKRPGKGLDPREMINLVGRRTRATIEKDQLLDWEMIE